MEMVFKMDQYAKFSQRRCDRGCMASSLEMHEARFKCEFCFLLIPQRANKMCGFGYFLDR